MAEDTENKILELKRKIEILEKQNNKLQQENGTLSSKVLEADQRYGQNTQDNQLLKSEIENLRDMLKKSDEERDKLRRKVVDMSKVHRRALGDKNQEIEGLKERVTAMDSSIKKQGQEIEDLTAKIPELLQDKKDLKEALKGVREDKTEIEKDVNLLQDSVDTLELKLKATNEELSNVKEELEEERDTNTADDRSATIHSLEDLNHKLKLEIQAQRQSAVQAERRLKDAEEQLASLRVELEEQVEEMEKAMMDTAKFKELNGKLETDNKVLLTQSEELREQLRDMGGDQKLRLEDNGAAMRKKISVLTERLGTMEATAKSLMIMTKEKQHHNDEFLNEIKKVRSQNRELQKQLDDRDNLMKKRVRSEELPREAHKKLIEENRRLRTLLAMKSMAEQNSITRASFLQEKLFNKEEELERTLDHSQRLEEWLNEIFNNKNYQSILKHEYKKMEEKLGGKSLPAYDRLTESLPGIPPSVSLISPRTLDTHNGKDITPRLPTRGTLIPRGPSQAPRAPIETVIPPTTGYSTTRGRLAGTYSRKK